MKRLAYAPAVALTAALLPVVAVNAAYMVNLAAGLEGCFPYLEGCQSVSRAVRSGPGLWLFKALALPCAAAMAASWLAVRAWLRATSDLPPGRSNALVFMGLAGALFFLVYAAWLGTEGEVYRWLRRYGVVIYFAGTGLAHLLLAALIWPRRGQHPGPDASRYVGVVGIAWGLGILSGFKRRLLPPDLVDRAENVLEWNFALALSLCFLALAPLLRRQAPAAQEPGGEQ